MKWGNWIFNSENLTLLHETEQYEIDLKEINSSAVMLDWIFQVHNKTWAGQKTMFDLLQAFEEILNPQANYCSFGKDRKADGDKLAREFVKRNKHN